ncbi:MAG: MBL fold metallo-hydrolase [Bradymonadaceae bacterium]
MAIERSTSSETGSSFEPLPGNRRRPHEVTRDLVRVPNVLVNAYLFGMPEAASGEWVVIDTGLGSGWRPIVRTARRRFGPDTRPAAIVLTHGHFDHAGSCERLADYWDVDVYAHPDEMPYLTGQVPYPPPDPSVGGGMMARTAGLYPRGPLELGDRIQALPEDGSIPGMPEWEWVHTPGHTPGHVSLFRERDRLLVAGDAFVTVKQESAVAVAGQYRKVHGPPAYYTTHWPDAWDSVRRLANLGPEIAATGHGLPMRGETLRRQLDRLVDDFDRLAVPESGRYVRFPVIADEYGVHYVPPPSRRTGTAILSALGLGVLAGAAYAFWRRRAGTG